MLYKNTFRKETKIVGSNCMPKAEKDPRVLAYEKPVRFGRSSSPKVTAVMRPVADGDKLHEPRVLLLELREVYSL
jgi:hypothetical protein